MFGTGFRIGAFRYRGTLAPTGAAAIGFRAFNAQSGGYGSVMNVSYHRLRLAALPGVLAAMVPVLAYAHASEQALVLLLPTDVYIMAGAASVALTVMLLALLPHRFAIRCFRPLRVFAIRRTGLHYYTSCVAFALFALLVWAGLTGSRDPVVNPLPLFVWTVFWVALVSVQGLLGNIWHWLNPLTGPVAIVRKVFGLRTLVHLNAGVAPWLALVGFLAFAAFLMADPAPTDPARLARFAAGYWLVMFAAALVCGPRWIMRAEAFSVLMTCYGRMGLFGRNRRRLALGLPGWQAFAMRVPSAGLAVFMLVLLGSGSFDGLNETFWWLAQLGINPLEFPGRSAVVGQNIAGLLIVNAALVAVFSLSVWGGSKLGGSDMGAGRAFRVFAPSILPIALGYHIAHYLTALLVDGQYVLIAISDPFDTGANFLGLDSFYVTTGFFNTTDTVRVIWLTQAGAVVAGHIIAIVLAHAIAVREFATARRAVLSQVPLATFMVLYTFFGLWLLASPRGM